MSSCFICNHTLFRVGIAQGHTIMKCPSCGIGVTKQLISQNGVYHRDKTYIEEENLFKNIFNKRVNIISRFKSKGKALEVGCSTGILLGLLKDKGWGVKGVEISETAARKAKAGGIDVIMKSFQSIDLQETFDLIIFNHTLEHLGDPKKVLEKAYVILNKKGFIYIDLPNYGGVSANILGLKWSMLLPEEHLWHFTYKALKILLTDLGFKIIFVERASGVWDYGNPLKGILVSLFSFKKRFFIESLTAIPSWVISKMGMGSDLMVIAKKI